MSGVVAYVVSRYQPGCPKLSLYAEVPLLKIGRLEVQRMRNHVGIGLKRQVRVDRDRERIAARLVYPGIG